MEFMLWVDGYGLIAFVNVLAEAEMRLWLGAIWKFPPRGVYEKSRSIGNEI